MMPILLFDLAFPRRKLPESAPTVLRLSLEVVASLLVYDTLFSVAHVAFHKVHIPPAEKLLPFFGGQFSMGWGTCK